MTEGSHASEIAGQARTALRGATRASLAFARARPVAAAALATALVSLIALLFPALDIAVASLFWRRGVGFPAEHLAPLVTLRLTGMAVTRMAVVVLVLLGLAKLLLPMLARGLSSRKLLFLALSLTLGPGLLVNGLLKAFWGRPRPWQITDFGGPFEFYPAWMPGGACPGNCSFPSGEASSAIWLIALAFVVPPACRRATVVAALAWTAVISLNRMAFGGHFLFDVLIAWGLVLTIVLACRALVLERIGPVTEARIDAALATAGERLLGLLRAPGRWLDRARD